MLQCVVVCCSVLQCVTVCCSVLQHTATHCTTLQHTAPLVIPEAKANTPQTRAIHRNLDTPQTQTLEFANERDTPQTNMKVVEGGQGYENRSERLIYI